MSGEAEKAVARRLIEGFWNTGDRSVADEVLASDFLDHVRDGATWDRQRHKQFWADLRGTYADLHVTIDDLIAEGNTVALRLTYRGTHRETGIAVAFPALFMQYHRNGQITDNYGVVDALGVQQQLGKLPAPTTG